MLPQRSSARRRRLVSARSIACHFRVRKRAFRTPLCDLAIAQRLSNRRPVLGSVWLVARCFVIRFAMVTSTVPGSAPPTSTLPTPEEQKLANEGYQRRDEQDLEQQGDGEEQSKEPFRRSWPASSCSSSTSLASSHSPRPARSSSSRSSVRDTREVRFWSPPSEPFDEWTEVFGSERLTGALVDRLTHRVHILEMNGESPQPIPDPADA